MRDFDQSTDCVEWLKQRGPAVILGNPHSLFVTQLGRHWRRLGLDVHIVSTGPDLPDEQSVGLPVVDSRPYRPLWTRALRPVNVLLRPTERLLPWICRGRYRRKTGLDAPRRWELFWVDHYWDSYSRARAALALKPAFVFAQEAAAYGLSAARCRGTARIIFPWGGDVYVSCEASPIISAMIRRAFHSVERIVPSSQSAKDRICRRFDAPPDRVVPISWGVDLNQFAPLTGDKRAAVRNQINVPADAVLVMNIRRFDPLWGGAEALEAAVRLAHRRRNVFFLFLGSGYDSSLPAAAKDRVQRAGLRDRFRFFDEAVPLAQYAELVGVSDVGLSLMTQADMRSSSVLQAAAAGGVPVIGDTPEHRLMQENGFACRLIAAGDQQSLAGHLDELVANPGVRRAHADANRRYLIEHEDHERQMLRLLEVIADAVRLSRDDTVRKR